MLNQDVKTVKAKAHPRIHGKAMVVLTTAYGDGRL
jgi:hypothetical protein